MSILLAVFMVASVFTVMPLTASAENADAAEKPMLFGDGNGDGKVNIVDATYIQIWLAGITIPYRSQWGAAWMRTIRNTMM